MASSGSPVPSVSEYHCEKNSFRLQKLLGSGSTGEVYLALPIQKKSSKKCGDPCALKIVHLGEKTASKQAQLRAEVLALRTVGRHNNIIGLHNYGFDPASMTSFLHLSYVGGGDLLSRIEKAPFPESEAIFLFRDILSAIAHAHSKGICHRDLKLENILLTETGSAVVADWGLSSPFTASAAMTKDCGSLHYAAPEILSATPYYGHLVDSFSLGILFFAMVTGCFPFFGNSPRERFLDIITRKRLPFPSFVSPRLRDLIAALLCVVPASRLTAAQALQHSYFDSIREPSRPASSRWFDVIVPPVSVPAGADSSKKYPTAIMSKLFKGASKPVKQLSDDAIAT